jgi:hypothetical protein
MSRFQQLEDTFELPRLEDLVPKHNTSIVDAAKALAKDYNQKDAADLHDDEMNEIAGLALEYSKTLNDLGLGVEIRHAGEIFNASATMLKVALDARNSKMERKLKQLKLELDRLKLEKTFPEEKAPADLGNVKVLDRNALLEQLRDIAENSK